MFINHNYYNYCILKIYNFWNNNISYVYMFSRSINDVYCTLNQFLAVATDYSWFTNWHCHVSRVSVYFCFMQHSLWLNSSRDIGCMDSCLIDIASLQNVPQKENCSSRNAELNESYKYDSTGHKNLMIYCFWNYNYQEICTFQAVPQFPNAYFWRVTFIILYFFFIHIHKTCKQK